MTRLLDRGPHTVVVSVMKAEDTPAGRRFVEDRKVPVSRVIIQPRSSDRGTEQTLAPAGLQAELAVQVLGAGKWPGGPHSTFVVQEGPLKGITFDQRGEALEYGASPNTAHFTVYGKARGVKAR